MSGNKNNTRIVIFCAIALVAVLALGAYVAGTLKTESAVPENKSPAPAASLNQSSSASLNQSSASTTGGANNAKLDSVDVMAERLRARLEKEPNDVDGWVLLGRSYHFMQRWDDAKAAFAKARALGYKGDAETVAAASNAALPNETTAHAGNDDAVFSAIGQVGNETDNSAAASSARVRVAVDVAPELRAQFAASTSVFVFARAAQGSRMPLAVVRKTLAELPAEIDLDDSLAMLAEAKISGAATIVVGARLSQSGNPMPQPGDIEALSAALSKWQGQRVVLLLKK